MGVGGGARERSRGGRESAAKARRVRVHLAAICSQGEPCGNDLSPCQLPCSLCDDMV